MMAPPPIPGVAQSPPPSAAEADAFLQQVNVELRKLLIDEERAAWVKATYITDDTEKLEAQAHERVMEYLSRKIKEARRYWGRELPYDVARQLYLLAYSAGLPAPSDPAERAELAELASKLESLYGKGKYCSPKLKGKGNERSSDCLALEELSDVLAKERDYDLLLEAWRGWHTVAPPMRPMFARLVELGNKGARELGFRDMSEIWKGSYDMTSDQFAAEMLRLWTEVRPLYEQLHCYVRAKLRKKYGEDRVGAGRAKIPAHVLGNM